MPESLRDPDVLMALLAFMVTAAFAIYIVIIRHRAHERRMAVLMLAHKMLNDSFDAADALIASRATPEPIRQTVLALSRYMAEEETANAYLEHEKLRSHGKLEKYTLPDNYGQALRMLAAKEPRLVDALYVFINNFQTATLLRWSRTEATGLRDLRPPQQCVSPEAEMHRIEEMTQEIHFFASSGKSEHRREMAPA
jgi:hypothetical protein